MEIRRILFPTDFSEYSEVAFEHALTFAKEFGAELFLVHVVAEPPRIVGEYAVQYDPQKILKALIQEAEQSLNRLARRIKQEGIPVDAVIRIGTTFREIIDLARGEQIDLIVMGTHGRTGLSHALMGSVAEKVVRKAPCPVLTVKSPKMPFEMP